MFYFIKNIIFLLNVREEHNLHFFVCFPSTFAFRYISNKSKTVKNETL